MAWRRYISSMELALTLLSVKPMTMNELRLYYRLLLVRGLNVTGGWDEVESIVSSMVSRGIASKTPDGRIYIDRNTLPEEARRILEDNIETVVKLLSMPGGA
ncbi:MAG: hypothetical protein GSR86_06750 [Desulfurococcales archaeon]|nr:hypothetical protein [Desulfurococcales archaeon]